MVSEKTERISNLVRKKRKNPRWFFIDGELNKLIRVNRVEDLVICWNYPKGKRVAYVWSDAQRRMERAYTLTEAALLLNRHRMRLVTYIQEGKIAKPQRTYDIETRKGGAPRMSESDILAAHEFFSSLHRGRPRNDGLIIPQEMPTRRELIAMMQHGMITYVKDASGEFVPTWKERQW